MRSRPPSFYRRASLAASVTLSALVGLLGACSDQGIGGSTTGQPTTITSTGAGGHGAGGMTATNTTSTTNNTTGPTTPYSFEIEGVVVDGDRLPVAEAMVMQAGRSKDHLLTKADGSFTITLENTGQGIPTVVAAKFGYRAFGAQFLSSPDDPIELELHFVHGPDNEDYTYEDMGDGIDDLKEDCTHCHQTFVVDFLKSKHAEAARNPLVHDLYAGVSRAFPDATSCQNAGGTWRSGLEPGSASTAVDKCYLNAGVLPDLNTNCGGASQPSCDDPAATVGDKPTSFGACADCHAPGINGVAGGRNLHEATGLSYDTGVHCDACHKVRDIDMTQPPGVGQRLVMGRPPEPGTNIFKYNPVYYGPIIDVPNPAMNGSFQPKFNEAVFCAGCHEQEQAALLPGQSLDATRWPKGLPVHSTYTEWEQGPYAKADVPCQHCHMPATYDAVNSVHLSTLDNQSITFGFARDPEDIRQHIFRGPLQGEPRLIDTALYVSVKIDTKSDRVDATISINNSGCGHAVPTGEPMRSLILVVEADSQSCGALSPTDGLTVNDVGGAVAVGTEGSGVTTQGTNVNWPAAATIAKAGQRVRVVRPNGQFDDYAGIGFFADANLVASEKGMPVHTPVADAAVVDVVNNVLTVDQTLSLQAGDILYLGDAWPATVTDGEDSRHLAGKAGYTFARVLVDQQGQRQVPHYRAVDIASDNRIAPGSASLTQHSFARPANCTPGSVRAYVLYRPLPLALANERGWSAKDYIIAQGQTNW